MCVCSNPTKFVGEIVAISKRVTGQLTAKLLSSIVEQGLQKINSAIPGDYKSWMYKNYLVPSTFFHLAVNTL